MKRSIFLFLFFVVIAAGLWPNEQPRWAKLLTSLESERRILTLSLNSIENELNITKIALNDLKSEFSQMQSASEEQKNLLNESKKAVEERKSELEQEQQQLREQKADLERRERQLTESAGSLSSLKKSFDAYQKTAESEIQALEIWRGVALIGIPAAVLVGGILGAVLINQNK